MNKQCSRIYVLHVCIVYTYVGIIACASIGRVCMHINLSDKGLLSILEKYLEDLQENVKIKNLLCLHVYASTL